MAFPQIRDLNDSLDRKEELNDIWEEAAENCLGSFFVANLKKPGEER